MHWPSSHHGLPNPRSRPATPHPGAALVAFDATACGGCKPFETAGWLARTISRSDSLKSFRTTLTLSKDNSPCTNGLPANLPWGLAFLALLHKRNALTAEPRHLSAGFNDSVGAPLAPPLLPTSTLAKLVWPLP